MERNRDEVLGAARRVFLDRGYAGASVDVIADEAGFSKGVVYSQFGSKADMFLALLERRIEERAAENERIAAERPGADAIRELLRVGIPNTREEHAWGQVLVEFRAVAARDPDLNRRYAEAHRRTVGRVVSMLTSIYQRASVRPIVAVQSMAEFMLAVSAGISLERAADPSALPEDDLLSIVPRALGFLDGKDGHRRHARRPR